MRFYLYSNDRQTGPFSMDELRIEAGAGRIRPSDLVWREDWVDWKDASTVPGLLTPPLPSALGTAGLRSPAPGSQAPTKNLPSHVEENAPERAAHTSNTFPIERIALASHLTERQKLFTALSVLIPLGAVVAFYRWSKRLTFRMILKRGSLERYFFRVYL